MPVVIICGIPGMGKTTYVRNHIESSSREAIAYTTKPQDYDDLRMKEIYGPGRFNDFVRDANHMANTLMVIDEGEIVIPEDVKAKYSAKGYKENPLLMLFANCREYKNFIYLILHDLRDMRPWLFKYTDFLIRFRTRDQFNVQDNRFDSFPVLKKNLTNHRFIAPHKYMTVPFC
ncbi:MAG: hypothetical protein KGJ07_03675 [Patescibacteria group bacterium]|nr:hypothetical protein [Patescibacteria group bacterium]